MLRLPPIRVPRPPIVPLSFAQEQIWFLEQLIPGTTAYHVPIAVRVVGALDSTALTASLNAVIARHESLRTVFPILNGSAHQVVLPDLTLAPVETNLSALARCAQDDVVRADIRADRRRPFCVDTGPLVRLRLWRLGPRESVVLLTLHHMVTDGWSMGVLMREIAEHYAQGLAGKAPALPPLPIQYADYALWQREWLQGFVLEKQLAYWRDRLADCPATPPLTPDYPRPVQPTYAARSERRTLSPHLTAALRAFSRSEGASLFMTLFATLAAAIARVSGQDDLVVATAVANRRSTDAERLIGCFVNTLALRVTCDAMTSLRETVRRVRRVALDAAAHQDVPFERVVDELRPQRGATQNPIAQLLFAFQNTPLPSLRLGDAEIVPIESDRVNAQYDVEVFVVEGSETLQLTLQYASELFAPTTVQRLLRVWERMLASTCADADMRVAAVPLWSEDERRASLDASRGLAVGYAEHETIIDIIARQAERTPNRPAVVHGDASVTYRELHEQANAVAARLRSLRTPPHACVAVYIDRCVEQVAAVLGILKAGATFVPIDPLWPDARVRYVLQQTSAAVMVSRSEVPAAWRDLCQPLYLFDDSPGVDIGDDSAGTSGVTGDHLAYVIYTSGSTGVPNGVMVSHRNLLHSTLARLAWYEGPVERFLWLSPLSFDSAIAGLFWTLCTGGALHIPPTGSRLNIEQVADVIEREEITHVLAVPSLYAALAPRVRRSPSVRVLIAAGERCPTEWVKTWTDRCAHARLCNEYGPTEGTVWATAAWCYPTEATVPIGGPIANVQVYVVDTELELLPAGVPGEIVIGGAGVTPGYVGNPALTAQRFIPDPFTGTLGARLYRTGDWGRRRTDGTLEYIGRRDQQVKINGVRIELGEIEAVLYRHPGIRQGVVETIDHADDGALVAYIVTDSSVDSGAIRTFLQQELSARVLPREIVVLPSLPLTPNGKIDRAALRAIPRAQMPAAGASTRSWMEDLVATIWSDALGSPLDGDDPEFFALGGNSLKAVQVAARVRAWLGIDCPLRTLFDAPRLSAFTCAVDSLRRDTDRTSLPPLVGGARPDPIPLSFSQERLWFVDQLRPGNVAYNVPVAARFSGDLDREALAASLNDVVARHESLRTVFRARDGVPHQVVHSELAIRPLVRDLTHLSAEEQNAAVIAELREERTAPFALAAGPLIRSRVLLLDRDRGVLLLTLHHIVTDGWSMGVLLREMAACYAARRRGVPAALPPLPIQYAEYAVWQRRWLQPDVLEGQLQYWRRQLAGSVPTLALTAPNSGGSQGVDGSGRVTQTLASDTTSRVRELCREQGVTMFMALLSGFAVVLRYHSGQVDMVIGTDLAGRDVIPAQALIGFFVNQLALRLDLSGHPTFTELLQRLRQVALDAYANRDAPFEQVVQACSIPRDGRNAPLFQAKLVLQTPSPDLQFDEHLIVEPLETAVAEAKFDLLLNVTDEPALRMSLEYSSAVGQPFAHRLLDDLRMVLSLASEEPSRRLGDLITDAQRARAESAATYGRAMHEGLLSRQANTEVQRVY